MPQQSRVMLLEGVSMGLTPEEKAGYLDLRPFMNPCPFRYLSV